MFSVGDLVCYPMHGVGQIDGIVEQTVLGETRECYRLRFETGRMTVLVPVDSAEAVGLRSLSNEETCAKTVSYLINGECASESDNWNQRYRDNLDKLKTGDIITVAGVVKCLRLRDKNRGLSAGERKMYLTARQVLLSELIAATGKEEADFLPLIET